VLDEYGLALVDEELPLLHVLAERRVATHAHAALAQGSEAIADALADHLALELR
jgi:hypothetical protein